MRRSIERLDIPHSSWIKPIPMIGAAPASSLVGSKTFGDQVFHHVAVRVEDIEQAIERLKAQGVVFAGQIVGARGGQLRQIFTAPEMVDGQPFSVL